MGGGEEYLRSGRGETCQRKRKVLFAEWDMLLGEGGSDLMGGGWPLAEV